MATLNYEWETEVVVTHFNPLTPQVNMYYVLKQSVIVTVMGRYRTSIPYTATITDLLCFPEFWSFLIHPLELSGSNQQTPSSEAGETSWEMSLDFSYKYIFHTYAAKSYDMGPTALLTSPPKEVVLRNLIALPIVLGRVWTRDDLLSSAGFEPANLGPTESTITTSQ
jgi:hypothetical protein